MTLDELIRAATEKAASMGMRIELVAHGPDETPEPTDRLTVIEARLAALESAAQPTPPAQTRTYPEVEWSECRDGLSYGKVNGAVIGIACEDGDHRFLGGHWKQNQGSIDTAKIGVVSELRRWWDDLHTTPTPNQ